MAGLLYATSVGVVRGGIISEAGNRIPRCRLSIRPVACTIERRLYTQVSFDCSSRESPEKPVQSACGWVGCCGDAPLCPFQPWWGREAKQGEWQKTRNLHFQHPGSD